MRELLDWMTALLANDPAPNERRSKTVQMIKERLARPTLSERFIGLLDVLGIPDKAEPCKQFSALNRLRNDLLHATITTLPTVFREYNVDETLIRLALQLLNALADRLIADARSRGLIVVQDIVGQTDQWRATSVIRL